MDSIWLGLWPNSRATRILAMRGASETILKGRLPLRPSSGRAVTALLEAIALWEGRPVRAVLVADASSTSFVGDDALPGHLRDLRRADGALRIRVGLARAGPPPRRPRRHG